MAAATSVHVVAIVEPIIQHADWFFPEGRLWVFFYSSPVFSPTCFSLQPLRAYFQSWLHNECN